MRPFLKLRDFVHSYLSKFNEFSSKVKNEDRQLLFPKYLVNNYLVRCTISKRHGATIEFIEKGPPLSIEVSQVDDDIDYVVLPRLQGSKPMFICKGQNTIIRNLNLITQSYYNHHKENIENLSRSTNFVMDDVQCFVKIETGDVRLIDVGIAHEVDGGYQTRRIDCLWLIADNNESYLGIGNARDVAFYDYSSIISQQLSGVPITILISTLQAYKELIECLDVKESAIQGFLEKNFIILEPWYKRAFNKDVLRKLKLPEADFLLKTSDGKYVIIELESPQDNIFTNENPPNPSKELRNAQSQIQNYLSFFRNKILYCKEHFPDMMVENVSGLIVIGRRNNLTLIQSEALQKMPGTITGYQIMT